MNRVHVSGPVGVGRAVDVPTAVAPGTGSGIGLGGVALGPTLGTDVGDEAGVGGSDVAGGPAGDGATIGPVGVVAIAGAAVHAADGDAGADASGGTPVVAVAHDAVRASAARDGRARTHASYGRALRVTLSPPL